MVAGLALGFVVGALAAMVVAVVLRDARARRDETEHAATLGRARSEADRLTAELEGERRVAAERQIAWDEARNALKGEFATLSADALRQSNEQFFQLASGRLELAQQAAKGDLDQRTKSIEQLLDPCASNSEGTRKASVVWSPSDRALTQVSSNRSNSSAPPTTGCRSRPAISSRLCVPPRQGAAGASFNCGASWRWRGCSSTATSTSRSLRNPKLVG